MSEETTRQPPRWAMRAQWRVHKLVWNASGGRLGRRVLGMPVIEVETVGRVSGEPRRVLLTYVPTSQGPVVVASNAGALKPPAWYRNLDARPQVRVREAGHWDDAVAEELRDEARESAWARAVSLNAGYLGYVRAIEAAAAEQGEPPRRIPLVRLVRLPPP